MLAGFRVANFLSFKEMQKFSMIKGRSDKHLDHIVANRPDLLDRAVIYGPNSAGKSNFMTAVAYAQGVAIGKKKGAYNRSTKVIKTLEKMSYDGSENPYSYFEFLIHLDGILYSYGFEYDCRLKLFKSEWLIELLEDGSEDTIFSLSFGDQEERATSCDNDREQIMNHKPSSTDSFLSISNNPRSRTVFNWMWMSLYVVVASDSSIGKRRYYEINNEEIQYLFELLYRMDTGIDGISLRDGFHTEDPYHALYALKESGFYDGLIHLSDGEIEQGMMDTEGWGDSLSSTYRTTRFTFAGDELFIDLDRDVDEDYYKAKKDEFDLTDSDIYENIINDYRVSFSHRPSHFLIDYRGESDGTKKILEIIMMLLNDNHHNNEWGFTLFYDEFECSIHVLLIKELLKIYDERRTSHRIQLITTTHESRILSPELYRNDEVWFVDSDNGNGSAMYSLESFKDADGDKDLDEEYLKGRFGAIPSLLEFLEEGRE